MLKETRKLVRFWQQRVYVEPVYQIYMYCAAATLLGSFMLSKISRPATR
jgi:hypothetical protein